jgi:hypothetical protein
MMKKRKPRLNTCDGCMIPYRYVKVNVKSVKEISEKDNFGYSTFEVIYTFAKDSYYHDVYGDKEFVNKVSSNGKPYKVGAIYLWQMSIDID